MSKKSAKYNVYKGKNDWVKKALITMYAREKERLSKKALISGI